MVWLIVYKYKVYYMYIKIVYFYNWFLNYLKFIVNFYFVKFIVSEFWIIVRINNFWFVFIVKSDVVFMNGIVYILVFWWSVIFGLYVMEI